MVARRAAAATEAVNNEAANRQHARTKPETPEQWAERINGRKRAASEKEEGRCGEAE